MDEETIITNAATFLMRADIKGNEVPAFNAVMEWLETKHQELNTENLPYVDKAETEGNPAVAG